MPAPAKTLISYVPALVARRFEDNPRLIIKPTATYLKGTVLGLHLSGLAELVKRLINPAAAASDDLNRLLKTTFERLVDMFVAHGGDVFKFSEDTLLAMWTTETSQERVEATVLRAAQCALALQTNFHHQPIMPDLRLSLRVTIGAGEILTTDLGGVYGRWEFLISGNPLSQVRQLEAQAQPGQVILSREAWSLVEDKVQGQTQDQGCYRLQAVRSPLPLASLPGPPGLCAGGFSFAAGDFRHQLLYRNITVNDSQHSSTGIKLPHPHRANPPNHPPVTNNPV
jgi:class 3 adenylate cyclase